MSTRSSVLIVDDEAITCERLEEQLAGSFEVETYTNSQDAIRRLGEQSFDVVVTDLKMEGPSGMDVLQFLRTQRPETQVILITGYAVGDVYRDAEYSGVFEIVLKPFALKSMASLVKKAARKAARAKGRK